MGSTRRAFITLLSTFVLLQFSLIHENTVNLQQYVIFDSVNEQTLFATVKNAGTVSKYMAGCNRSFPL